MTVNERIEQAVLLKEAASPTLFNDALTDPINVLADMSNGTLARVGTVSQSAEDAANRGQEAVGNQLMVMLIMANGKPNQTALIFDATRRIASLTI